MNIETYLLAIHFLAYGFQHYINQKVAVEKHNRFIFICMFSGVTCFIMMLWLFVRGGVDNSLNIDNPSIMLYQLLAISILGGGYLVITNYRLKAQELLPTYASLPLTRSSIILVLVLSVIIFNEEPSKIEMLVSIIAFILLSTVWVNKKHNNINHKHYKKGVMFALTSSVYSAVLIIISKLFISPEVSDVVFNGLSTDILLHPLVLVLGANVVNFSLSLFLVFRENRKYKIESKVIKYGFIAGILNSIAYSSLTFFFLENGEASKIYTLSALSIVIPTIILQFKKEEPFPTQVELISYIFAVMAIVMLVFE